MARRDLGTTDSLEALVLQGTRIVGGGNVNDGDMLLVRFRGDGALDSTFGGGDGEAPARFDASYQGFPNRFGFEVVGLLGS
jgi:hypothetical protein